MATSADRDEDEKDEAAHAEGSDEHSDAHSDEHADEKGGSDEKKEASSAGAGAKKAAKEHAEEDDEEDEGEGEGEEDEEAERPAKRSTARGPGAKGARGPGATRARPAPPAQGGSLGKSMLLFFVIVVGLGAGFSILGRETPAEAPKITWKEGQSVDVEVTLVRSDRQDLACGSAEEIGGKHCAFEAANKPWTKSNDLADDKKILKPYTTTDRIQFAAAGLWSDPGLAPDKLPATRFSAKCKLKVEGKVHDLGVRWEQTGQWYPNKEWFAGTISDCKLNP